MDAKQEAIVAEKKAFEAVREALMKEHGGEFVLFKDEQARGFFSSHRDAYQAGIGLFGPDAVFLVEELADRPQPCVSLTWELGLMHVVR